jgi:hypothetical protein
MGACYSVPDEAAEAVNVARRLKEAAPTPLPGHVRIAESGQSAAVYNNGGAFGVVAAVEATSGRPDVIAIVEGTR